MTKPDFNSTVVQLEERAASSKWLNLSIFQFYCSPIRRLEVLEPEVLEEDIQFQFYCSPIRSVLLV